MTEHFRPAEPVVGPPASGGRLARRSDLVPAKILVVDDDPRNLFAVEEMLRAPGIEVVTADSGEAALRHVLKEDFAVILLDVQMPRIDGYEVAGLIRSRARSSRVPILFLTAFNKDDLHVFRGYSAGAVDYVFKPIEPLILKSKVDVFVDLYRKTEEIRRQGEEERRLLMENLRVRSEKLKTEQALRRREEHQSIVLQSLPIALYTASIDGGPPPAPLHQREHRAHHRLRARRVPGARGFLGVARSTRKIASACSRSSAIARRRRRHAGISLALRRRHRAVFPRPDGARCADDEGRPREIFGMWFDITERKQLEQNLLHASKLEAVGRLTGGIAHDFNNMLSVVIGNLDLLQKVDRGQRKGASGAPAMAMEGAQRCADLTHRLLAFSRRQPLQASTIDVKTLMPGLLELMRRTLGERINVTLRRDEATLADQGGSGAARGGAPQSRGQRPRRHAGRRRPHDRAREPDVEEGGRAAGDYVDDLRHRHRHGMPPQVLERVFEPFFTTKESGKGTGLGLSMVYGFVQQSDGPCRGRQRPRPGHDDPHLPAACRGEAAEPRPTSSPEAAQPVRRRADGARRRGRSGGSAGRGLDAQVPRLRGAGGRNR